MLAPVVSPTPKKMPNVMSRMANVRVCCRNRRKARSALAAGGASPPYSAAQAAQVWTCRSTACLLSSLAMPSRTRGIRSIHKPQGISFTEKSLLFQDFPYFCLGPEVDDPGGVLGDPEPGSDLIKGIALDPHEDDVPRPFRLRLQQGIDPLDKSTVLR